MRTSLPVKYKAILAVLPAFALMAGAANAQECAGSDVKVYVLHADRVTERIAALEEMVKLTSGSDGEPAPHPLLLVRYALDSKVHAVHRLIARADGGYCDAPESVRVGFGPATREVFLAAPAASESCVLAALLAHADEHDRMLEEAIHEFLQQRGPQFAQEVRELEARRSPDENTAVQAFETGIEVLLARLLNDFKRERLVQLRQTVDSPDRLAALSRSCDGRVEALEKTVRQENP
jgi:hypothetical protein